MKFKYQRTSVKTFDSKAFENLSKSDFALEISIVDSKVILFGYLFDLRSRYSL